MTSSTPVAFSGCAGLIQKPKDEHIRATAIVLCPNWGFDELCARKFYRHIAKTLCANGFPTLRFDYPGTVDSLDMVTGESLEDWLNATNAACDLLKNQTGCVNVALFGLGLGAMIAQLVSEGRQDIVGLILSAPVINGRRYLRETSLRAKMIVEGLGLAPDALPKQGTSIGGLMMSDQIATDLKSINLEKNSNSRPIPTLVWARQTVTADATFAEHLVKQGVPVTTKSFLGYEYLMDNPTSSKLPLGILNTLGSWCDSNFPDRMPEPVEKSGADALSIGPAILQDDEFEEEGLILRTAAPLHGILCKPKNLIPGPVFVFLNAGYDHHGGWARNWVKSARALAREGHPSFRFDMSNIGDSPEIPGEPDQVLYTDGPINDVSDVLAELADRISGDFILVGRCSGAYTAFHAGFRDNRVKEMVLINQLRFIWDTEESITDAARMGPRSMADYKKKMVDTKTLKRLLAGDINIRGVLRGFSIHARTHISHMLAPVFPNISKYARFRAECHRMFAGLSERGVPMHLLCSEGDESLEQLCLYFGNQRQGLKKFPLASVTTLVNADHNLTPFPVQGELIQFLKSVARRS
ncbi:alpha/beta hydrolase [Roseibium algae]|uniref:Alpha/beta fold hydrolase n=1 Tax=Roseibium algae TaxID=3123038 RepID=A0ABU8TQY6_9HYPH